MAVPLLSKLTEIIQGPRKSERRRHPRLYPGQITPCQIRLPDGEQVTAWVHTLSISGASVVTPRSFMPGATLSLLIVNGPHMFSLSIELTVIRCKRIVTGEFVLGGQFSRVLKHDELSPFLM